ncbi:Inner membrane protein ALBINO3, chloroplastic [Triticum urartu]|uniref:Inner membrane protein ALBINO3, chloroplastic n=1 Tax=Triticum urartu TaxID=4572 RepID=M7YY84_TRIUA|nr:Inner membrane protein ALBINO3, chloroplastic [Triticum urartu]
MEVVLKILKDGLSAVHVPYAYGFAIILLTIVVKAATLPLTKQQVESTMAMQNLQPQLKAIQARYAGNQERIQLETARLYKQAGVNPLAGCLPTLATIPVWIGLYQALSNVANEDGHPPIGWHDTICYLVLPVLLVASQFVSMEIMKPPQSTDPSQKNTQLILKFLPFMIGYFSLSVPSGLSIYWFTNNVLSTAQQIWLRKLGGAKPAMNEGASGIITAGRAKRSGAQSGQGGERFKQLKEEENRRKAVKALGAGDSNGSTTSEDEESDDDTTEEGGPVEETFATGNDKKLPTYSGKKGKRKRGAGYSGQIVSLSPSYPCNPYNHRSSDGDRQKFYYRQDRKVNGSGKPVPAEESICREEYTGRASFGKIVRVSWSFATAAAYLAAIHRIAYCLPTGPRSSGDVLHGRDREREDKLVTNKWGSYVEPNTWGLPKSNFGHRHNVSNAHASEDFGNPNTWGLPKSNFGHRHNVSNAHASEDFGNVYLFMWGCIPVPWGA